MATNGRGWPHAVSGRGIALGPDGWTPPQGCGSLAGCNPRGFGLFVLQGQGVGLILGLPMRRLLLALFLATVAVPAVEVQLLFDDKADEAKLKEAIADFAKTFA